MSEYPKVLVLNEKHGDRYFHIESKKHLLDTALKILVERDNEGYWYDKDEEHFKMIKKALETKDGELAWRVLQIRTREGYEYENAWLNDYEE